MKTPYGILLLPVALMACKSGSSALDASTPPDGSRVEEGGATASEVGGASNDLGNPAPPAGDASATPAGDAGATPIGCAKDLSGTWDLIAARPGDRPESGVLTIAAGVFSLSAAGHQLTYNAGPTKQALWVGTAGPHPIAITNTAAALDTGSLPLAVGGDWEFLATTERCSMHVSATAVSGSCLGSGGAEQAGGSDWPNLVPNPRNQRTYTIFRTAARASQFGELGGTWQTAPGSGNCLVSVDKDKLSALCVDTGGFSGTTVLTIGSDCVASGTSSGGFAISARRR
jgi:hypothetical protein